MNLDPTVQVALVTGVFGFLAALLGLLVEAMRRQRTAIKEARRNAEATRAQVQNDHTKTNLRDDVDQLLAGMEQVLKGQERHDETLHQYDRELDTVRRDLHQERDERLAVEQRLDRHLDDHPQP